MDDKNRDVLTKCERKLSVDEGAIRLLGAANFEARCAELAAQA